MSEGHFRRDLARFLDSFKPDPTLWAYNVKSLRELKSMLQQYAGLRVPDPDPLSENLMKCLHPSMPQGLHAEALEVYDTLLFIRTFAFDTELACYVNALVSFYEFAAPENKLAVLRTFDRLVDVYAAEVRCFMPGLVLCVLPGLEDPGNKEALPRINSLFEKLAKLDHGTFHVVLWTAILRTHSEGRYGGLSWLHRRKELFIPHRQLVLNALMTCLEDKDMRVRRSTLDLIKEKVSILVPGQLSPDEKIALLAAVFRSPGRANEPSLVRRMKEWVIASDYSEEQINGIAGYCAQAAALLLESFSQSEEEVQESIAALYGLLHALDDTPELKSTLLQQLAYVFLIHIYKNAKNPCFASLQTLISSFVTAESSVLTWKSLNNELMTALNNSNLANVLIFITFALDNFPFYAENEDLQAICRLLLVHFAEISIEWQYQALLIAQKLLNQTEILPIDTGFQQNLPEIAQDSSRLILLPPAISICIALSEPGAWMQVIYSLFTSTDPAQVLFSIKGLWTICSKPAYEGKYDESVPARVFEFLWSCLDFAVAEEVVDLMMSWYSLPALGFSCFFCEKLKPPNLTHIHHFSTLWSSLKLKPQSLSHFSSGEEVFLLLEGLESDTPQIRHAVREWLMDSLSTFAYILDPFIEPLLEFSVKKANKYADWYANNYGNDYIPKFLKKIRALLLHGSSKLRFLLQTVKISPRIREISPNYAFYSAILLDISLKLVQMEGNEAVRFSACEVLEEILECEQVELAAEAGKCCLGVIIVAINEENWMFQLQLLGILRTALLACSKSRSSTICQALFSDSSLGKVLISGISSKNAYIRSHWTEFVCQMFPVVLNWMPGAGLAECIREVVHAFAEVIRTEEAKEDAFRGLRAVVEAVVSVSTATEAHFFVTEYETKRQSANSSGLLASFFSKSPSPGTPFDLLHTAMISRLEEILQACQSCLQPRDLHFHASIQGLVLFDKVPERWAGDQYGDCIQAVLFPLFCKWQVEFFAAIVSLWLGYFERARAPRDISALDNLIRLFAITGLSPAEGLGSLAHYLSTNIDNFIGINEVQLVHFLVTLLLSYHKESYPETPQEKQQFTETLLGVVEELNTKLGVKDNVQFWLIDFLVHLHGLFPYASTLRGNSDKQKFQKVVEGLLSKVYRHCQEDVRVDFPFPPSILQLAQDSLPTKIASFHILCVHLSPLLTLAYQGKALQSQLEAPVTMLTKGLAERSVPMHMLTSLLHALVKCEGEFITNALRGILKSTVWGQRFFKSLEGDVNALRQWGEIVESMTLSDSRDRDKVIEEIFSEIPTGILTTQQNRLEGALKTLKIVAFCVYGGGENCYAKALPVLLSRLTTEFCGDEVLSSAFLVLRALALRLSQSVWENFYVELRPYLLIRLIKALREGLMDAKAAAMKLLELLITLGYEKFRSSEWLFLYDSPNIILRPGPSTAFQPVVVSALLPSSHGVFMPSDQVDLSVHSKSSFSLRPIPRQSFFNRKAAIEDMQGQPFLQYAVSNSAERLIESKVNLVESLEFDLLRDN